MAQIRLTMNELLMAAIVGLNRRMKSMRKSTVTDAYTDNKFVPWYTDIEAAAAECALAKYLNIFWDGSEGTFKAPDLGDDIQVRCSSYAQAHLIVRDKDDGAHRYILLTGEGLNWDVRGWMFGYDAKKDTYFRQSESTNAANSWWVPQSDLEDVDPQGLTS